MNAKEKATDRRTWVRMGWELATLRELLGKIFVDEDYQRAITRREWNKLDKAIYYLDAVRSDAEDRMARFIPDWSTRMFYPTDRTESEAIVKDFRARVAKLEEDVR